MFVLDKDWLNEFQNDFPGLNRYEEYYNWYSIVYGNYESIEKAKEALEDTQKWATEKGLYTFKGTLDEATYQYTMYTAHLVREWGNLKGFDASFYNESIKPIMLEVLKEQYLAEKLLKPGYIHTGRNSQDKFQFFNSWHLNLLTYDYRYDTKIDVAKESKLLLMKYGDFEHLLDVDTFNPTDTYGALTRQGVLNSIATYRNDRVRYIQFNHFTEDSSSEAVQLLTTKEFWTDFVIPQVCLDWESVKDTYLNVPIKNQEFVIKSFVRNMLEKEYAEIKNKQNEYEQNREEVETYIRSITTKKLVMNRLSQEIDSKRQALSSEQSMRIKLAQQLKTLSEHEYVTSIDIDNTINIETTAILVDGVVPIGPYRISLSIGDEPDIKVVNTYNPMNYFDHPHINEHRPCWGNYTDVYVHLANLDLISTAEILFRFLESWNPEDTWGKNLINWDPNYAFKVLREMDLLCTVGNEWDEYYYEIYDEHLESNYCSECGEHTDDCYCYCPRCGELIGSDCDCNRCPECDHLWESGYRDCYCDRCEDCDELISSCECETCPHCGDLLRNCACDICEDCENLATECTCEHETEQEEVLF